MNRVVVVEQVYYQAEGAQPLSSSAKFARIVESAEEPYFRRVRIGEEWASLDVGWVQGCSLLTLQCELTKRAKLPTKAEAESDANRTLLLWDGVPGSTVWRLRPGESMRGCPAEHRSLQVRCEKGECFYTVRVYPR